MAIKEAQAFQKLTHDGECVEKCVECMAMNKGKNKQDLDNGKNNKCKKVVNIKITIIRSWNVKGT